ncbi:MAG: hypothetical protein H0V17_13600 [Deltaproteobacteria bacterium]|nr:hypothetical protein [Deltaproteobacteria bacterium]
MTTTDGGDNDDGPTGDAPPGCTRPSLDDAALATQLSTWLSDLPAPRATIQQRGDARTYLQAELTALGLSSQLHTYNNAANVIATLPATMGRQEHHRRRALRHHRE